MKEMKLDLDTFSNMVNDVLTEQHIQMLIDMPEGTQEVTIKDNTIMGPVTQFYILLAALPAVFRNFSDILDETKTEDFVDSVLEMVKREVLKEGE